MVNIKSFTDESWNRLSGIVASACSMSPEAAGRLKANVTARLVAALPFLAGCRESERTALAHLAVFVLAESEPARRIFDHKKEDDYDVLARLAPIGGFEGGDPRILNQGMKALAVLLIEGYKRDIASDKAKGWYNPVGAGTWDADKQVAVLRASIKAGGPSDAESFIDEALSDGWWS